MNIFLGFSGYKIQFLCLCDVFFPTKTSCKAPAMLCISAGMLYFHCSLMLISCLHIITCLDSIHEGKAGGVKRSGPLCTLSWEKEPWMKPGERLKGTHLWTERCCHREHHWIMSKLGPSVLQHCCQERRHLFVLQDPSFAYWEINKLKIFGTDCVWSHLCWKTSIHFLLVPNFPQKDQISVHFLAAMHIEF